MKNIHKQTHCTSTREKFETSILQASVSEDLSKKDMQNLNGSFGIPIISKAIGSVVHPRDIYHRS